MLEDPSDTVARTLAQEALLERRLLQVEASPLTREELVEALLRIAERRLEWPAVRLAALRAVESIYAGSR
jgi:hypothetical protein